LEGGRRRGKMDLRFPELQSIYIHIFTTWMLFVIDIMDSNGKIC
jgi:hypothetical protein